MNDGLFVYQRPNFHAAALEHGRYGRTRRRCGDGVPALRPVLRCVPLAAHIHALVREAHGRRVPGPRVRTEWAAFMSEGSADETLRAMTGWARCAALFTYDDGSETFAFEDAA